MRCFGGGGDGVYLCEYSWVRRVIVVICLFIDEFVCGLVVEVGFNWCCFNFVSGGISVGVVNFCDVMWSEIFFGEVDG